MDFESRYHRFSAIRFMGLLNERLYGPIQVKHAAYLMFAVLIGWRGLALGNGGLLALAVVVAFLGFVSAVTGIKTMSLEAKILATLHSLFDSLTSREDEEDVSIKNESKGVRKALKVALPVLLMKIQAATWALAFVPQSSMDATMKSVLLTAILSVPAVPHILERPK